MLGHTPAMRISIVPLALIAALASCVAPPREAPVVVPAPRPAAVPTPAPAPAPPQSQDWRDWPMTAGAWRYLGGGQTSVATFGVAGAPPLVTFRCKVAARRIVVQAASARVAGQMGVRTTFGATQWPLQADGASFVAIRPASDATLDQIAFSRGRFMISVPGSAPTILPTWAEVTRVIEDCRG